MKPGQLQRKTPLRRNKFNAIATHDLATGRSFDSLGERRRLAELEMLQRGGAISELVFKPPAIVLDAAAGIKWRMDYTYIENGRRIWEDHKPRPFTAAERLKLKLWQAHGPGLLRITGHKGGRSVTLKTFMGRATPSTLPELPAQTGEDGGGGRDRVTTGILREKPNQNRTGSGVRTKDGATG